MGACHLRVDLEVLSQGIHLAVSFGLRPLEEMALIAELLEHSVYDHGSLRLEGGRVGFTLLNPPLRMGAFSRIIIFWDGAPVASGSGSVAVGNGLPRSFDSVDRDHPVDLPIGRRTRFSFIAPSVEASVHRVRLELRSVAIPPTVWFEFADHLRTEVPP